MEVPKLFFKIQGHSAISAVKNMWAYAQYDSQVGNGQQSMLPDENVIKKRGKGRLLAKPNIPQEEWGFIEITG